VAKLNSFKGGVELISGISPKNNNDFALVDAHYVQVEDEEKTDKRLDEKLSELTTAIKNNEGLSDLETAVNANTENITKLQDSVYGKLQEGSTDVREGGAEKNAAQALELATKIQDAFVGQDFSEGSIDLSKIGNYSEIWYKEDDSMLYLYDPSYIPDGELFDPTKYDDWSQGAKGAMSSTKITGGGGGGSASASRVRLKRVGNSTITVKKGDPVVLTINYASVPQSATGDDVETLGIPATAKVFVNKVLQTTVSFIEGDNNVDITQYVGNGTSTVSVTVTNEEGVSASIYYTVVAVELTLTSNFSDALAQKTTAYISVTPTGNVTKTLHVIIDGKESTTNIGTSNTSTTVSVSPDGHRVRTVKIYVSATLDGGIELESNALYYEIMFITDSGTSTLIRSNYDGTPLQQYTTYVFKYSVYNPKTSTSLTTISIDDGETVEVKSEVNADRSEQTFSYKPMEANENLTLIIESGGTRKEIPFTVEAFADADKIKPITGVELAFDFSPEGRTNNDVNKDVYEYNGYKATFSDGFDWVNGGWLVDENNIDYLCIKAGDTLTIDYPLFGDDPRDKGKNFKVIFKAVNCKKFDAQVMSCLAEANQDTEVTEEVTTTDPNTGEEVTTPVKKSVRFKAGIQLTAQSGDLYPGNYKPIEAPYLEDELLELEYNIQSKSETREIVSYLSADPVCCRIYDENADMEQTSYGTGKALPVVFGSEDCDVHLYRFKVYTRSLSMEETLQNFYGDSLTAEDMSARYNRNQILNDDGELDYNKIATMYPEMRIILIECPVFTNGKSNTVKGCTVQQIMGNGDPVHNWTATGVSLKGQGTSSDAYGDSARNLDIKCSDGFDYVENGETKHSKTYAMTDDSIGVNYFNMKVNVASSENANNSRLAERYNQYQPFIRQARKDNPKVRDTMEFHPCIIFIKETGIDSTGAAVTPLEVPADGNYHFYAAGDFGNSKKNAKAFGMTDDPLECIIEFSNNTSPQCLFKKGTDEIGIEDFKFDASNGVEKESFWDGNVFEFRYPDVKDFTCVTESSDSFDTEEDYQAYVTQQESNKAYVNTMVNNFRKVWEWTESTNQQTATNNTLTSSVTYNGVKYTKDTVEYRKAKFAAEVGDYYVKDSLVFHYLFTERFIMIDNRAKNTFIHYNVDGDSTVKGRWDFVFNYDNDTALGCDNSGYLTIPYGTEDTDQQSNGDYYFNGAQSGLWCNVRDCLNSELRTMATNLSECWRGANVIQSFNDYQDIKPEVLEMKDMWKKYLRPAEGYTRPNGVAVQTTGFIERLNGKKKYQRARFETYQDAYFSSKYATPTAVQDSITGRFTSNIGSSTVPFGEYFTLTPYSDLYVSMYFDGIVERVRAKAGVPTKIYLQQGNEYQDKNYTIRSASMLQDLGDLSPFYLYSTGFGPGKRIQKLLLGNEKEGYFNSKFDQLSVGSTNTLLEEIDLRGCAMTSNPAVDVSMIPSLKRIYTKDSGVSSIAFANGAMLELADINNVNGLTLRNLYYLSDENLKMDSYENLQRLIYENCPSLNELNMIKNAPNLNRVRLVDVNWTDDEDEKDARGALEDTSLLNRLVAIGGINENGINTTNSVLTGKIQVHSTILPSEMRAYQKAWNAGFDENSESPLIITGTGIGAEIEVVFRGANKEVLYSEYVEEGNLAPDPLEKGYIKTPTKASDDMYDYTFNKWSIDIATTPIMTNNPSIVNGQLFVDAEFTTALRTFTVIWKQGTASNSEVMVSTTVTYGDEAVYEDVYKAKKNVKIPEYPTKADSLASGSSTVMRTYLFKNWDRSTGCVTQDMTVYPVFEEGVFGGFNVEPDYSEMSAADVSVWAKNFELNEDREVGGTKTDSDSSTYFFPAGTKVNVQFGYMPDFNGSTNDTVGKVTSEVIVGKGSNYNYSSPIVLDGNTVVEIPEVQLLKEDKDFVLALDFSSGYKKYTSATSDDQIYNTIMSIAGDLGQSSFDAMETRIVLTQNTAPKFQIGSNITENSLSEFVPSVTPYNNNASINKYYYNPRQIVVIRHTKGQQGLTIYYKKRSNPSTGIWSEDYKVVSEVINFGVSTLPPSGSLTTSSGLIFGARKRKSTGAYYAKGQGKINYCKVWYGDLGDTECKKIASWIYEKREFAVGSGRAYSTITGNKTTFTFIDTGMLDILKTYHTSSSNRGGFKYSLIREYLNGTVYNAMSNTWRSIIKLVNVSSIKGGASDYQSIEESIPGTLFPGDTNTRDADGLLPGSATIPSQNYIFLPSYAEVAQSDAYNSYNNELPGGDTTKYFVAYTDAKSRIKTIETYVSPSDQLTPMPWPWLTRSPAPMGNQRGVGNVNYLGEISSSTTSWTSEDSRYDISQTPLGVSICFTV
jgi:hypothetical protein